MAPGDLAERQVLAPGEAQRLRHARHHAQAGDVGVAASALANLPRLIEQRAVGVGETYRLLQRLNGGLQRSLARGQIARLRRDRRPLLRGIGRRRGEGIGLEQRIGFIRHVMHRHAAAGKGAVHQRFGGGASALQRAGAHVNIPRLRATSRQQAELAIMFALPAPFIDHRRVAVAGQLAVARAPYRPGTLRGGLNLFAVARRGRTHAVAAQLYHLLQLIGRLRGGLRCPEQQGADSGKGAAGENHLFFLMRTAVMRHHSAEARPLATARFFRRAILRDGAKKCASKLTLADYCVKIQAIFTRR